MLADVSVAGILARLVSTHLVSRPFHQGGSYGLCLLARGGSSPYGVEAIAQPLLVALGLLLVVPEHLNDFGVFLEKKGGLGLPGPSGTEDRSAPILCARVASSD